MGNGQASSCQNCSKMAVDEVVKVCTFDHDDEINQNKPKFSSRAGDSLASRSTRQTTTTSQMQLQSSPATKSSLRYDQSGRLVGAGGANNYSPVVRFSDDIESQLHDQENDQGLSGPRSTTGSSKASAAGRIYSKNAPVPSNSATQVGTKQINEFHALPTQRPLPLPKLPELDPSIQELEWEFGKEEDFELPLEIAKKLEFVVEEIEGVGLYQGQVQVVKGTRDDDLEGADEDYKGSRTGAEQDQDTDQEEDEAVTKLRCGQGKCTYFKQDMELFELNEIQRISQDAANPFAFLPGSRATAGVEQEEQETSLSKPIRPKRDIYYIGQWYDDKPHGDGLFQDELSTYQGQWREGEKHGFGFEKYYAIAASPQSAPGQADAASTHAEHQRSGRNTTLIETETYIGQHCEGEKHGKGRYIFSDGNTKTKEGLATTRFKSYYEGEFDSDVIEGQGMLISIIEVELEKGGSSSSGEKNNTAALSDNEDVNAVFEQLEEIRQDNFLPTAAAVGQTTTPSTLGTLPTTTTVEERKSLFQTTLAKKGLKFVIKTQTIYTGLFEENEPSGNGTEEVVEEVWLVDMSKGASKSKNQKSSSTSSSKILLGTKTTTYEGQWQEGGKHGVGREAICWEEQLHDLGKLDSAFSATNDTSSSNADQTGGTSKTMNAKMGTRTRTKVEIFTGSFRDNARDGPGHLELTKSAAVDDPNVLDFQKKQVWYSEGELMDDDDTATFSRPSRRTTTTRKSSLENRGVFERLDSTQKDFSTLYRSLSLGGKSNKDGNYRRSGLVGGVLDPSGADAAGGQYFSSKSRKVFLRESGVDPDEEDATTAIIRSISRDRDDDKKDKRRKKREKVKPKPKIKPKRRIRPGGL
ncbi:unnamed protein product [Amoebophrya sp. A120]|nr:unnamed protein product [Amoebophrya sp. A120]|eukprot:GSA120T00006775001.1